MYSRSSTDDDSHTSVEDDSNICITIADITIETVLSHFDERTTIDIRFNL